MLSLHKPGSGLDFDQNGGKWPFVTTFWPLFPSRTPALFPLCPMAMLHLLDMSYSPKPSVLHCMKTFAFLTVGVGGPATRQPITSNVCLPVLPHPCLLVAVSHIRVDWLRPPGTKRRCTKHQTKYLSFIEGFNPSHPSGQCRCIRLHSLVRP